MGYIDNSSKHMTSSLDMNPYLTRKASMLNPFSYNIDDDDAEKQKEKQKKEKKKKKAIDTLKKLFGY